MSITVWQLVSFLFHFRSFVLEVLKNFVFIDFASAKEKFLKLHKPAHKYTLVVL